MFDSITIAGIKVSNTTLPSLLSDIEQELTQPKAKSQQLKAVSYQLSAILTVNPEIVVQAHENPKLKEILNTAWRTIPDGVGITLAARMNNTPLKQRITGVELTQHLLALAQERQWTVGVIGGKSDSTHQFANFLNTRYPTLSHWTSGGPWINTDNYDAFSVQMEKWLEKEGKDLKNNLDKTSVLFVSMGAPKQEYFIHNLQHLLPKSYKLKAKSCLVAVAVGGTFDELSGLVPASPELINQLGLKWLFRLITQPWRIKRQLRLLNFILLIVRMSFHKSKLTANS